MKLPLYKSMPNKIKPEIISFGGLNLSDSAKVGELRAAKNLTSDYFPFIGTRRKRFTQGTYNRPTALFDWNGLVVVDGTDLIYNGAKVGTVAEGEKQFAVTNTRLVIWPDKMYLDLSNNEFKTLTPALSSQPGGTTFTENSLTMNIVPKIGAESPQFSYTSTIPIVKTYTDVSWTSGGGWVRTGAAEFPMNEVPIGRYIIPKFIAESGAYVVGVKSGGTFPAENNNGRYFKVTARTHQIPTEWRINVAKLWAPGDGYLYSLGFAGYAYYNNSDDPMDYVEAHPEIFPPLTDPTQFYSVSYTGNYPVQHHVDGRVTLFYDVYSAAEGPFFTDYFKVGDLVTISGCTTKSANNKAAPTDMDDELPVISAVTNDTLTFSKNVFIATATEAGTVTVKRYVPNFSYICAKDNRLWGVWENLIYGSALGDPSTFFDYSGTAEDSYVTPVGTKGDFTGICAYGGQIFAWKEDVLHRIIGGYPAEYYLYTDNIPGLQAGCQKSQIIINDILYYKSKQAVYSYSGNTPRLVGYKLGLNKHSNAVAGTDGLKLYVSMYDTDGRWGVYVYDTLRDIWLPEDDLHVTDFAYREGTMFFLDGGSGNVFGLGASETEDDIQWSAEFVEFTENSLRKKHYSKIYLRIQLYTETYLKVETSIDGGAWKQAYITHNENLRTITVPLIPARCDEFRIRLSGTGRCIIKALEREFTAGSEV
jgi:hypothetical protein